MVTRRPRAASAVLALALAVAAAAAGKTSMTTSEVYQRAVPILAGLLSDATRQGLPVPVRRGEALRLAVIVCPVVIGGPNGTVIGVPTHVGEFALATGELDELRTVTPAEFGQPVAPDGVLGTWQPAPELTFARVRELRAQLFADLDILLPAFARDDRAPAAPVVEAARRFEPAFALLGEPPLAPWYRALGRDFFDWLDRLPR